MATQEGRRVRCSRFQQKNICCVTTSAETPTFGSTPVGVQNPLTPLQFVCQCCGRRNEKPLSQPFQFQGALAPSQWSPLASSGDDLGFQHVWGEEIISKAGHTGPNFSKKSRNPIRTNSNKLNSFPSESEPWNCSGQGLLPSPWLPWLMIDDVTTKLGRKDGGRAFTLSGNLCVYLHVKQLPWEMQRWDRLPEAWIAAPFPSWGAVVCGHLTKLFSWQDTRHVGPTTGSLCPWDTSTAQTAERVRQEFDL